MLINRIRELRRAVMFDDGILCDSLKRPADLGADFSVSSQVVLADMLAEQVSSIRHVRPLVRIVSMRNQANLSRVNEQS